MSAAVQTRTVRNRTAAPVQITAEQILREAQNYSEIKLSAPIQHISTAAELSQYKLDKRTQYEKRLRANSSAIGAWIKYAQFEAKLNEFERMRSIFERALDVDYTNVSLWLAYAVAEQKNAFINHARNVFDRAVTLLPIQNALWQKYTYFEEILNNIAGARAIYERWMEFHPSIQYWLTYINFELRHDNVDGARKLYERLTLDEKHNSIDTYVKWARFELVHGSVQSARAVYERALTELAPEDAYSATFLSAFAAFEIQQHEYDRVRSIYKFALSKLDQAGSAELFDQYVQFEKQYGSINDVEYTVLQKKMYEYNELVEQNMYDYDVWLDYIKMLIDTKYSSTVIVDLLERALTYTPPVDEKHAYKRYIYLYILYALYTETVLNDADKTVAIYNRAIKHTSDKKLHFAKLYINAAKLQLRLRNLDAARRLLGTAIGVCADKSKVFAQYIEIELQIGNIDRCRQLYEKQLSLYGTHSSVWLSYIALEQTLQEHQRVRALYGMALKQPGIDNVIELFNSYIAFEAEQQQYDQARQLYGQYLDRVGHTVALYEQFVQFELDTAHSAQHARQIYQTADQYFKSNKLNAERYQLLQRWMDFEQHHGTEAERAVVQSKQWTVVKKRKEIRSSETDEVEGYEEYVDYVFADDVDTKTSKTMSLLMKAKQWKAEQAKRQQASTAALTDAVNSEEISID